MDEAVCGPATRLDAGLVGREAELAQLAILVDDLAVGPGDVPRADRVAVVLTGAEGAGKSRVLSAVADRALAAGARVLAARGCDAEADLPYGVLHQLLLPVLGRLDALPDHLAAALGAALGLRPVDGSMDPASVSHATLQLLRCTADGTGLLVTADDVDRADEDSLRVLLYVARRVRPGGGLAVVLVDRGEGPALRTIASLPEVALGPLSRTASGVLLERQPRVPTGTRRWEVLDAAAGNPLALEELARAGTAWPSGADGRLEQHFARRLRGLPGPTRHLLLYAAAGEGEPPRTILTAAGRGDDLTAWSAVEQQGVVDVDATGVSFRHPLLRVAAYAVAPAGDRRRAHLALAEQTDDSARRVRHRARACVEPDEQVAAALEDLAREAGDRDAPDAAVRAFERAAECSPDPSDRTRRYLAALAAAHRLGDTGCLAALHERLRESTDDVAARAAATVAAASSSILHGRQRHAFRMVVEALDLERDRSGPGPLLPLAVTLTSVAMRSGLPEHEAEADAAAAGLFRVRADVPEPAAPAGGYERLARAVVRAGQSPSRAAVALEEEVRGASGRGIRYTDPRELLLLGALATVAHDTRRSVEVLRRAHALTPVPGLTAHTAGVLASALVHHGLWGEADEVVARWSSIADTHGMPLVAAELAAPRAVLLALRGHGHAAAEVLARARGLVDLDQNRLVAIPLLDAAGITAMAAGDRGRAFEALREAFTITGRPRHPLHSPVLVARLAACAEGEDEREEARQVIDRVRAASGEHPAARVRLLLHHADALVGPPRLVERHFRLALADPTGEDWPLDRALARMHYGSWLRRQRRTLEAREVLAAAARTSERLGATAVLDVVQAELRAAGAARPETDSRIDPLAELTSQQQQIVRLAAQGLRNREIAAQLFLSPRTVGSHLHHAYPKLGISGRHQLRGIVPGA